MTHLVRLEKGARASCRARKEASACDSERIKKEERCGGACSCSESCASSATCSCSRLAELQSVSLARPALRSARGQVEQTALCKARVIWWPKIHAGANGSSSGSVLIEFTTAATSRA
jgi:hypothetical protein